MPLFNAEQTVNESIESVLNQTFKDFEFLIIDDGCTDNSVSVVESFQDSRIKLLHNPQNMNLVPTLNRGLEEASGEYIIRMDADDICMPERFQKQVNFMDSNPEIGICGSWLHCFGAADFVLEPALEHDEIMSRLFFTNIIAHPTVIMRLKALKDLGLNYKLFLAEDFDLWRRASFKTKLHNIPEVLLDYRISNVSYSQVNSPQVKVVIDNMMKESLIELGIDADDDLAELHRNLGNGTIPTNNDDTIKYLNHLTNLFKANQKTGIYPKGAFSKVVYSYYFDIIDNGVLGTKDKVSFLWNSSVASIDIVKSIKFTLKVFYKKIFK